jgi:hypothetical protein
VVAFVPGQLQFQHIQSFDVGGYLHVCKTEVKAANSSKQLALIKLGARALAWFPTFELPLMA